MSRGPENTFIASVHKHLPAKVYRMKNNNQYNGGIADVWYSGQLDLWVEYKFIALPARDGTVVDLISGKNPAISALQQTWLRARSAEGRKVGVIVGCKAGGVWMPGVSWDGIYTAAFYKANLQTRAELAQTICRLIGA